MKESHGEGLAGHTGPESCGADRKIGVEALTGESTGWVLSRERTFLRGADAVRRSGRQHPGHRHGEMPRDPVRSETPRMYGSASHENRESLDPSAADGAVERIGKSKDERR
jgi:RNA-directed DNA polymerase